MDLLDIKQHYYSMELSKHLDSYGLIKDTVGDNLLYSSLTAVGVDAALPVEQCFCQKEKIWHRHPLMKKDNWKNISPSTISRDMLKGLLFYYWFFNKKKEARKLFWYVLKNFGILGKFEKHTSPYQIAKYSSRMPKWLPKIIRDWAAKYEPVSRIIISPSLLLLIAKVAYPLPSWLTSYQFRGLVGFRAHLQMLGIALRLLIDRKVSKSEHRVVLEQANREPLNSFFNLVAFAITNEKKYINRFYITMTNRGFFPTDGRSRYPFWLWERDSTLWDTKPRLGSLSYGDYMFAYRLYKLLVKE